MAELIISPSARQDLSDIFDSIARDKPIAAANWVDTIEKKCELIATTPELGEKRPEYGLDVRSSVVGRYVIFYRAIRVYPGISPTFLRVYVMLALPIPVTFSKYDAK